MALYSLGGEADLDRLSAAWKRLHQYRAKKYNWKMAPEDLRRSLQDLEGGFLQFYDLRASFVNPSVKDFLDGTLTRDEDNADDLLAAAFSFQQVVNVWSLAQSEKGERLRDRLRQSPKYLMTAASETLQAPFEGPVGSLDWSRPIDARPEVRLRIMLSIAEDTKSAAALDSALNYRHNLKSFWSNHSPDFRAVVEIFRALDQLATWGSHSKAAVYQDLKTAMLGELAKGANSNGFLAVIRYIGDKDKRWTVADRDLVKQSFGSYLEDGFDEEITDYDNEDALGDFSVRLREIGAWCGIDVEAYEDQISEAIAELERPDDDDVNTVREWDPASRSMPEDIQEREVRRIFSGFPIVR